MAETITEAFDLNTTYVQLDDGGDGLAFVPGADFWPSLISGQRDMTGRLVIAGEFHEDMTHWEMHPAGEELLVLLSGELEVVLQKDGAEWRVAMDAGQAFLVPRGAWHRFEVREPARMVFVTYGEGTRHRPV